MAVVVVNESKGVVVDFGGEGVGVFGRGGGGGGAEGGVRIVDGRLWVGNEVGDVFVAVVEVVGDFTHCGNENQWTGGDGFRGIPHIGVEKGVGGGAELLDAEVVIVDEALEEVGGGGLGAHFDAAAHAVEGHRNHGIAGLPADGAVFGIVDNRPNASGGFDEGLVTIGIVLGREVVDGGVLVEVVGGVGLAFGSGTVSHLAYARGRIYSNVVVIVGDVIGGGQLIADVIAILLVVLGGAAAEEVVGVDVGGIGGVGDGGEEVAMGFV